MRMTIAILLLACFACNKTESGEEYARKQAAAADETRFKDAPKAVKVPTPVPGGTLIPCDKLIDAAAFGTAIGEKEPVIVTDQTKSTKDAAAVCSVLRGGKLLTKQEQEKLLETKNRLGVLPGDPVCVVSAFCWSAENDAKFKETCPQKGGTMDTSLGFDACVNVFEVGVDNVNRYRFIDADTRCLLEVRGGPGMVDNEVIASCARTASAQIGLEQIKVP
jgi:hypothetical protein